MSSVCECCGTTYSKKWKGIYCSVKCQQTKRRETYITEWKQGKQLGRKGTYQISGHIRRYLHEVHNSSCSKCGWNQVNPTTGKIPLEINHINGDWTDNSFGNLELICPNCHALTPFHRGAKTKGKGRYQNYPYANPAYRNAPSR